MSLPDSRNPSTARRQDASSTAGPINVVRQTNSVQPTNNLGWSAPLAPPGSLAQKVRRKTITEAMWLLLICGVGCVIWGGVSLVRNENAINASYDNLSFAEKGMHQQAKDSAVLMSRAIWGSQIVIGAVFVALALTVNRAPLLNTALALFLFLAMHACFAVIEPLNLAGGLVGKILLTAALIGAVSTAYRYERAKKQATAAW